MGISISMSIGKMIIVKGISLQKKIKCGCKKVSKDYSYCPTCGDEVVFVEESLEDYLSTDLYGEFNASVLKTNIISCSSMCSSVTPNDRDTVYAHRKYEDSTKYIKLKDFLLSKNITFTEEYMSILHIG